jgi:hypothetical protein
MIRPDAGFVDLVSTSRPPFDISLLSESHFRLRGLAPVGTVRPLLPLSCTVAGG